MLEQVLQIIAPHYCCECGSVGAVLCDNCKYNIIDEPFSNCVLCLRPAIIDGICNTCEPTYTRAWVVSERRDVIRNCINLLKFERKKSAAHVLAELLDSVTPALPNNTIVTNVPTTSKHIRQRGYDHARLIAQKFAQTRKLQYQTVLKRVSSTVQTGSSKVQRVENAKSAFSATQVRPDATYVLIDDVFTTGATLEYASHVIMNAGAKEVWVAVLARQPLDK